MIRKVFYFIFCVSISLNLQAQDQLHVVTKKINEAYSYREGYEVNIEGDRAEVYIKPNLENKILINIEIIAKHPEQEVAQVDVEKMATIVKRLKNKIYVRNYLDAADSPESQLKVIYQITVPADCPVYVKNAYGVAEVDNLTNSVKVNSKFSRINLKGIQGTLDLYTRYGDIFGQSLNGNVTIASRRTDMILKDIEGNYNIDAEYGTIQIYASTGLLNLNLDADKSQVMLFNSDISNFRYDLTTVGTPTFLPEGLDFKVSNPEPNVQRVQYTPSNEYFPSFSVRVTFGTLQVQKSSKVKRP